MVQVFQASQLTLHDVTTKFGLQQVREPNFFTEWQVQTSRLSEYERQWLDKAQSEFIYLSQYPVQEELVKMVVLSPVLSAAGFYQHPFRPVAEKTVEIQIEEKDEIFRGRIDILVMNERLWVTVIEAKGSSLNWHLGLPQALTYMISSNQPEQTRFGLITNGTDLVFVKLQKNTGQYGFSKVFSLFNPGNDLYEVVATLRTLGSE